MPETYPVSPTYTVTIGLTIKQICEVIGMSESAVRNQIKASETPQEAVEALLEKARPKYSRAQFEEAIRLYLIGVDSQGTRRNCKYTVKQIAEHTGVPATTISECGRACR